MAIEFFGDVAGLHGQHAHAVLAVQRFRCDGERLCNPIGLIPMIGGRLARESFEPYLVMTDGFGTFTSSVLPPGTDPYRGMDGALEVDAVRDAVEVFIGQGLVGPSARREPIVTETRGQDSQHLADVRELRAG